MSRNRFRFLVAHLSFDEESTRRQRWKEGLFASVLCFIEEFKAIVLST